MTTEEVVVPVAVPETTTTTTGAGPEAKVRRRKRATAPTKAPADAVDVNKEVVVAAAAEETTTTTTTKKRRQHKMRRPVVLSEYNLFAQKYLIEVNERLKESGVVPKRNPCDRMCDAAMEWRSQHPRVPTLRERFVALYPNDSSAVAAFDAGPWGRVVGAATATATTTTTMTKKRTVDSNYMRFVLARLQDNKSGSSGNTATAEVDRQNMMFQCGVAWRREKRLFLEKYPLFAVCVPAVEETPPARKRAAPTVADAEAIAAAAAAASAVEAN